MFGADRSQGGLKKKNPQIIFILKWMKSLKIGQQQTLPENKSAKHPVTQL